MLFPFFIKKQMIMVSSDKKKGVIKKIIIPNFIDALYIIIIAIINVINQGASSTEKPSAVVSDVDGKKEHGQHVQNQYYIVNKISMCKLQYG